MRVKIMSLLLLVVTACGEAPEVEQTPDAGVPDATYLRCSEIRGCSDKSTRHCTDNGLCQCELVQATIPCLL